MPARSDLATDKDLKRSLLTVRRGTAFYSRQLSKLSDHEMNDASALPGWTRRHLIAHVGYNARALTRLVKWANTGVENPMYESAEQRADEIEMGATLPARALRNLSEHAAISLNVEWRDTPDDAWQHTVRTAQGREVPLRETVWMRTREVWIHAVDLRAGARFFDIPREVLARLLRDIVGTWSARGQAGNICIEVTDDPSSGVRQVENSPKVVGTLAAVTRWASGRGSDDLDAGHTIEPPRWI